MRVLIAGLGAMGFSMAQALHHSKNHTVAAYAPHSRNADAAKAAGINFISELDAAHAWCAQGCDVLLIAVKPAVVREVAPLFRALCGSNVTVVSVAAGISTESLAALFAGADGAPYPHVVYAMPTMAARVQKSITAVSAHEAASSEDKARARSVAESFGGVLEIDEHLMGAFIGVAGSGIAFIAAFMDALSRAGVALGMDGAQAKEAVQQAAEGAVALLGAKVFASPEDVIKAVCSPGGTTLAGMAALQQHGLVDAAAQAVRAAAARSDELGRAASTN